MKLGWLLAACIAAGGCSSKPKDPAQLCADAAARGVEAMVAQARARVEGAQLPDDVRARVLDRQKQLETASGKMRAVFAKRCLEDAWSTAAISCFTKATTLEEMRACRKQLAPDQQATLQRDELALLAGATSPAAGDPRLAMLDSAIADARKAVADAKDDAERSQAQAQLATLEAERTALQAQVDGMRPADEARKQIEDLRKQIEALDEKIRERTHHRMNAQSQVDRDAAKQEIEDARRQRDELRAQELRASVAAGVATSSPAIEQLRTNIAAAKTEHKIYSDQLASATDAKRKAELEAKVKASEAELARLEAELAAKLADGVPSIPPARAAELARLEAAIAEKTKRVEELRRGVAAAPDKSSRDRTAGWLAEAEAELRKLHTELAQAKLVVP